ncbi:MAG: hypothetical protein C4297_04150 [Gemmataceae bacterium]
MASSMLTGVTGLRVHQQLLDVVGNNLANVNTIGFKSQRVRFSDLSYQTFSQGTRSVANNVGGTNPMQVGLGVRVSAIDTSLQQGTLETTGGDFDLAIQGNGLFVVNSGSRDLYTRAGAFGLDEDNYLVDPATGYRVQRFGSIGEGDATTPAFQTPGDTGIKIPFGTSIPGRATTEVVLQGNLSAQAVGPLKETLTSASPFTSGGTPATPATLLNALDTNTSPYAIGDQLIISGTDVDGSSVNFSLSVDTTTTMADLLAAISAAYSGATASLDAAGNLVLQADNAGPASLSMTIADHSSNVGGTNWAAHGMRLTVDGKDGDKVATSIQIYDEQGTAHSLSLTFIKKGNNLWDLVAAIPPADGTLTDNFVSNIQFNDDGSFRQVNGVGPGDADIELQIIGLSGTQTIRLNFGTANGFDGVTQFGGSTSVAATSQDGFAAGSLTSIAVAPNGQINGVFTNGRTLPLAQLALAVFPNPAGLLREGENYFSLSVQSGLPLVGAPMSGSRGSIQRGTLESSNVDVALEFTRLITAQRGFQINTRTITVSDQVLQELANIIR